MPSILHTLKVAERQRPSKTVASMDQLDQKNDNHSRGTHNLSSAPIDALEHVDIRGADCHLFFELSCVDFHGNIAFDIFVREVSRRG